RLLAGAAGEGGAAAEGAGHGDALALGEAEDGQALDEDLRSGGEQGLLLGAEADLEALLLPILVQLGEGDLEGVLVLGAEGAADLEPAARDAFQRGLEALEQGIQLGAGRVALLGEQAEEAHPAEVLLEFVALHPGGGAEVEDLDRQG